MTESATQNQSNLFHDVRLSDDQCRQYDEQGYFLLGRTLADAGLEQMRSECMNAWSAENKQFSEDNTWLQNSLLANIHHRSPSVRQYYFHGPIVDVVEQLIGPNVKAVASQLTFKMRGNTKPFGWHQDNGYGELDPYNAISSITAMDDTDEENGCLWVIPQSHKKRQIDVHHTLEKKQAEADINVDVDNSKAIPVPMKAGEAMIFHCWLLHSSGGNLSKTYDRRLMLMRYADADAVEVYNDRKSRLGKLLRGETKFPEVAAFEADLQ